MSRKRKLEKHEVGIFPLQNFSIPEFHVPRCPSPQNQELISIKDFEKFRESIFSLVKGCLPNKEQTSCFDPVIKETATWMANAITARVENASLFLGKKVPFNISPEEAIYLQVLIDFSKIYKMDYLDLVFYQLGSRFDFKNSIGSAEDYFTATMYQRTNIVVPFAKIQNHYLIF